MQGLIEHNRTSSKNGTINGGCSIATFFSQLIEHPPFIVPITITITMVDYNYNFSWDFIVLSNYNGG